MAIKALSIEKGKYFIPNNGGCVCKTLPFRFPGTFVCWASRLSKVPGQGVGQQAPPQKLLDMKKEGASEACASPMLIQYLLRS